MVTWNLKNADVSMDRFKLVLSSDGWPCSAMDLGRPKAMKPQFKELFQHNLNTEWHGGDRGAASPKFSDCVDTVIPEKGDDARDPQSRR